MYTLAHLSDPHVPTRLAPGARALLSKRLFGYLSWMVRRRRVHRQDILSALKRDIDRQAPDHIAVTGDLVNISLPAEFESAVDWLRDLGPPDRVTVVPGNHDAYVAVHWAQSWALWADYMTSEAHDGQGPRLPAGLDDFPFVRRRGPVGIVGLSTALPTPFGRATGLLGPEQLKALAEILRALLNEGLFRIVLLHHPPVGKRMPHRKRLIDAGPFRKIIEASGAELILHGHDHQFSFAEIASPFGSVPVLGVPSASALAHKGKPMAQYHLYKIASTDRGWAIEVKARKFDPVSEEFIEADQRSLNLFRTVKQRIGEPPPKQSTISGR